jgi:hypothetical protein
LLVYHWLEQHQPIYCCLTDGSGGGAASRLLSTTRLLNAVGASVGPIYGRYPDKQVYRLLLDGRVDVFVSLTKELAVVLEETGVDCVAGDAIEGFNPVHDACRLILNGAVQIVRRRTGRDVRNYDFLLHGRLEPSHPGSIVLRLDEVALDRKLAAANAYADSGCDACRRRGRRAPAAGTISRCEDLIRNPAAIDSKRSPETCCRSLGMKSSGCGHGESKEGEPKVLA